MNGRYDAKQRVHELVVSGRAAWCAAVRLELWNGRSGPSERRKLEQFERLIDDLPITEAVWKESLRLAVVARAKGLTFPAVDLLIFACAAHHRVEIESVDGHFNDLMHLQK